jgi:hypothetical protein
MNALAKSKEAAGSAANERSPWLTLCDFRPNPVGSPEVEGLPFISVPLPLLCVRRYVVALLHSSFDKQAHHAATHFYLNSSRQLRHFRHRFWGSVTDAPRDRCFHLFEIQHAVPGILATARRADSPQIACHRSLESPRLRTVTPDRLFPTLWIYLIKAVDAGTVALDSPGSRSTIEGHKR